MPTTLVSTLASLPLPLWGWIDFQLVPRPERGRGSGGGGGQERPTEGSSSYLVRHSCSSYEIIFHVHFQTVRVSRCIALLLLSLSQWTKNNQKLLPPSFISNQRPFWQVVLWCKSKEYRRPGETLGIFWKVVGRFTRGSRKVPSADPFASSQPYQPDQLWPNINQISTNYQPISRWIKIGHFLEGGGSVYKRVPQGTLLPHKYQPDIDKISTKFRLNINRRSRRFEVPIPKHHE